MPSQPDDLENRVLLLEHDVTRLREQAAFTSSDAMAARLLAAEADRDVAGIRTELRAHTRSLNALRETQLEQGQKLDSLGSKVGSFENQVGSLQGEVGALNRKMTDGFATLNVGMAQITALLTGMTNHHDD